MLATVVFCVVACNLIKISAANYHENDLGTAVFANIVSKNFYFFNSVL